MVAVEQAGTIASSDASDASYIAETVANTFINGTTDSDLEKEKVFMRSGVRSYCKNFRADCSVSK